jgi:hydroxymethylpyrimidine pyrophosphatase-like HAD family hydrolase
LQNVVFIRPLEKPLLMQLCNLAACHALPLELFPQKAFYVQNNHPMVDIHSRLMDFRPQLADLAKVCRLEDIILGCIVAPVSEENRVRSLLENLAGGLAVRSTLNPVFPSVRFINITAAGISKGTAVAALLSHLGLKKAEVVAMGDADNDLSLFAAAGFKVAMANASPHLIGQADYVTAGVEQNGVSQAIQRIFG